MVQHALKKKVRCYWEHPWGMHWELGEHHWEHVLEVFKLLCIKEHWGVLKKGGSTKPSFPLCLGWNEMDINITQQVNRWVFETQIKMWVIMYPSKMIVLSIILWKYCGSWMGRIVDRLHMGIYIYIYVLELCLLFGLEEWHVIYMGISFMNYT